MRYVHYQMARILDSCLRPTIQSSCDAASLRAATQHFSLA